MRNKIFYVLYDIPNEFKRFEIDIVGKKIQILQDYPTGINHDCLAFLLDFKLPIEKRIGSVCMDLQFLNAYLEVEKESDSLIDTISNRIKQNKQKQNFLQKETERLELELKRWQS